MDESIKIGDFRFSFLGVDEFGIMKFQIEAGSIKMPLYDVCDLSNPNSLFANICNDIWLDEYNEPLSMDFEDSSFCFFKYDMPKCKWEGEYLKELPEVDILVRYTDPWTNNIATLTNKQELELFVRWYNRCKEFIKAN